MVGGVEEKKSIGFLTSVSRRVLCSGALLFVLGFLPSALQAATWNVNVINNLYKTQSSLNPADVNTNHITIDVGDTIVWTWVGNTHTVTSSTGSAAGACSSGDNFNSGTHDAGFTLTQTFNNATPSGNDCKYFCSVHSSAGATSGMIGFIQVGGFTPPPSGGGGGGGATAAVGNFNGDAYQDLAVVDSTVGKVEIFMNNGAGGFPTTATSIIPPTDPTYTPVSVAAGSFNSSTDSFDDLVVVEKDPDGLTLIAIYFGDGAGNFTLYKRRSVTGLDTATDTIVTIERGDFTGDGIQDLVVTGPVSAQTNDIVVVVLPGDGTGNFGNTANWPPIGNVIVSPSVVYLEGGQVQTFTATVFDNHGNPYPNVDVNWQTSNSAVCSITANGPSTDTNGKVTADSTAGSVGADSAATITAYAGDPNNPLTKSGTTTCNVLAPENVARGIRAFSISSQVSGANLSVSTTVLNDGTVKVDSFRVGIYLSADNVITPGSDMLIGSRIVPELQRNASSSATQLLSLAGVPTGTYYVGMYADDLFQIDESGTTEGNNAKSSTTTYPIGPNLKVFSIVGTLSGANISVSSTVQNAGNVTAPAPFDVEFYFSSDTTLDGGDTLIGSRTVTSDLGVNQTDSASSLIPIPPTLSTGTYRLLAFVDSGNAVTEINEGDNVKATSGTYLIGPDLRVYSLIANLSGGNVIASDTEINSGNQPTVPSVVSFYLSTNTTLDGGDLLIGSRSVGAVGVNATDSASTTLSLASVPVGNYYLCAASDSGNAVIETNETNNSKCATTLLRIGPDLKVFNLTAVLSAGNISVTDTEINSGNQVAGAATVTFYLSSNTTLDGSDIVLGSRNFASLGINGTDSATTLFSPGDNHGVYYVIAVTDSGNAVDENNSTGTGESNNTKVSGGINIP